MSTSNQLVSINDDIGANETDEITNPNNEEEEEFVLDESQDSEVSEFEEEDLELNSNESNSEEEDDENDDVSDYYDDDDDDDDDEEDETGGAKPLKTAVKQPETEPDLVSKDDYEIKMVTFNKPQVIDIPVEQQQQEEKPIEKKSKKRTRRSLDYATLFQTDDDNNANITGDFISIVVKNDFEECEDFDVPIEDVEIKVEESTQVIEVKSSIDREYYYDQYEQLSKELTKQRQQNIVLHKIMGEYYKKRRMDHALKESDSQYYTHFQRYERKLLAFGELKDATEMEQMRIDNELTAVQTKRDQNLTKAKQLFQSLNTAEYELTKGMVFHKTGKPIPEKLVERVLKRQRIQILLLARMRFKFIKMRNELSKKQDQIRCLDDLGGNLHLMDYEQLKQDNRNHADRLEERDNELVLLRIRCSDTMQILAHIREKLMAIMYDRKELEEHLETAEITVNECREQLAVCKRDRDTYRKSSKKIVEKAELLAQPMLLLDMENTMEKLAMDSKMLQKLKMDYEQKCQQVEAIKRNYELYKEKFKKS